MRKRISDKDLALRKLRFAVIATRTAGADRQCVSVTVGKAQVDYALVNG